MWSQECQPGGDISTLTCGKKLPNSREPTDNNFGCTGGERGTYYDSSRTLTIFENTKHIPDTILDMVAGIAHIIEKPLLDKGFLFRSQPFYLLRKTRNNKIEENRCDSSDETLCTSCWSNAKNGWKAQNVNPPKMKTHLQLLYPATPPIFPIAVASSPPNAPARLVAEKKNVARFCASPRLYHLLGSSVVFWNSNLGRSVTYMVMR